MNTTATLLSGLMFGAMLSVGWLAVAEDSELDSGPRLLPYQGQLDLDGAPYDGLVDVKVTLLDSVDGTSWTEEHEDVQANAGRFQIVMGTPSAGLPDWVFDAEQVNMQIAVREGSSTEEHTQLSGIQPLRGAPAAYWAAEGYNYTIQGDLTAAGSATIQGATEAALVRTDDLTVDALTLSSGSAGGLRLDNNSIPAGSIRYLINDAGDLNLEIAGVNDRAEANAGNTLSLNMGGADILTLNGDGEALLAGDLSFSDGGLVVQGSGDIALADPEHGSYFLKREEVVSLENTNATRTLGSTDRRFCVLRETTIKDYEDIKCEVSVSNGSYQLTSEGLGDNDFYCAAICVTW